MAKPGKRTRAIAETVDANKAYTITEAVALVKSNAKAKNETYGTTFAIRSEKFQSGRADRNVNAKLIKIHPN